MNNILKGGLIFTAGVIVGFIGGVIGAKKVVEDKCKDEFRDELEELRNHYESRIPHTEKVDADNIETIANGTPGSKEVNTNKTNYTDCYDKDNHRRKELLDRVKRIQEAVESEGPKEDDDRDSDIYEITEEYDDENEEPGYGDKKFFDAVEMIFYTKDGALKVSSWGTVDDCELGRMPQQVQNDEDELVHDILPVLEEMEFIRKPYDVMYIRDGLRNTDVKVTKAYTSSLDEEI